MSNIGICHVLFHVAYGLYLLYFVICHIFFESKGMGVQPALYMSVAFYQCSKLERVYLYLSIHIYSKKLYILKKNTNTKMKYRHKDPNFLETRTFTKHLESLQISILPFTCTMRDHESSFHTAESEKKQ
jgi:hypothetical protein